MKYLVKSPERLNKKRFKEGAYIELDEDEAAPLVSEGILQRAQQQQKADQKPEQKSEGK